jgi:hypothetical protein
MALNPNVRRINPGDKSRNARPFRVSGGLLTALMLTSGALAAPLSNPSVDSYNVRAGTETFAGLYKFTTNTLLVETAEAITNMGSDAIKFYLGSDASGQSGVTLASNITNLLTLVRDQPSYHQVLDMPFRHFVMWAYPFANGDEWWGSGYNTTGGAKDYTEMYALTQYLLTNYNNSGKTFYLGHWEGDGYLEVSNWTVNPNPATVSGMIGWLNNRQKAVDDAKAATVCSNVFVYNYAECNRVQDAMNNPPDNNVRVIDDVVPYVTNLDYLSYSSYDSQNLNASALYNTLDYMESMLPTNKASVVPGERIWIGEYGWGYESVAAQEPLNRAYIQRLLGWSYNGHCLPFILMWEMYSNYNPNGATNYCLIDYQDNKVPSWYLHNYFYNAARMATARWLETNGTLPSEVQFTELVTNMLDSVLPAPINLVISNYGSALGSNSSASVSGQLTQGVYGDDQAKVWVYYGTQDAGTAAGSWQHSLLAGLNTNFNPTTFTVYLTNLVAQTNYYFRFWASNASSQVWAPASSQFTTASLNPQSFGSQMKISFAGYNRGVTLTNFPVLVCLGTNCPGFSYSGFASPSGGDLRFADATGLVPLYHEIDEWNTNGTSYVWVQVPVLSGPTNSIWAYWGNPAATNPPAWTTNGSVWTPNFLVVYHLKENGFPYADSTGQHPALTGVAPGSTAGVVGHGGTFNGTSDYLNAGTINVGSGFTLSAWVNVSPLANNIVGIWCSKPGGYTSPGFGIYVNSYNTTNQELRLETSDGTNGQDAETGPSAVSSNQWHFVAAAVNVAGGTARMFVDGVDETAKNNVQTTLPTQLVVDLGRFTNSVYFFNGSIDEARIDANVRDSNWMWASWMTVASNSMLSAYSSVTRSSPSLSIGAAGSGGLVGTWPATGVGFKLYTTTSLSPPIRWSLATNAPAYINSQWQITLPTNSAGPVFYRLQSQ